jgi:hypothetical protein
MRRALDVLLAAGVARPLCTARLFGRAWKANRDSGRGSHRDRQDLDRRRSRSRGGHHHRYCRI